MLQTQILTMYIKIIIIYRTHYIFTLCLDSHLEFFKQKIQLLITEYVERREGMDCCSIKLELSSKHTLNQCYTHSGEKMIY